MTGNLEQRRRILDGVRRRFDPSKSAPEAVNADIHESWTRCARTLSTNATAPVDHEDPVQAWLNSQIRRASPEVIDALGGFAASEDYVAAVTDREGRIIWGSAGPTMSRRAEQAHFVHGSNWSESAAGTNAPGLALRTGRPATVFAGEHWCDSVQDWVCYAAPVRDVSGTVVGVIDLSADWKRASPLTMLTVSAFARIVEHELALAAPMQAGELRMSVLGCPSAQLGGMAVRFSNRQLEILTILAVRGGASLEELHALVYGDRNVSLSTLKAEVSTLRRALAGAVSSRPYRLDVPVMLDLSDALEATARRDLETALKLYRGPLLPRSRSPYITELRDHLDAAMTAELDRCGSPSQIRSFRQRG